MTISEAKDKVWPLRGQEVFPGVFTLSLNGSCPVTTLSYAYSDVVCGNVKFRE